MSEEIVQQTGEVTEATPAIEESTEQFNEGAEQQNIESAEQQTQAEESQKLVPLEVVESMREQMREIREQNQQYLQLILSNNRLAEQQQQQTQEEPFPFADDEFLTGAQLKAVLEQQRQQFMQQQQQTQLQQRQSFITDQETKYRAQFPDYDDVVNNVIREAQTDPALKEMIMNKAKDPVDFAYKYGKLLRGESLKETATVKTKVNMENKIQKNLNQPKTLSNINGGRSAVKDELDPEAIFRQRLGQ